MYTSLSSAYHLGPIPVPSNNAAVFPSVASMSNYCNSQPISFVGSLCWLYFWSFGLILDVACRLLFAMNCFAEQVQVFGHCCYIPAWSCCYLKLRRHTRDTVLVPYDRMQLHFDDSRWPRIALLKLVGTGRCYSVFSVSAVSWRQSIHE